ncbi:MAG: type I methionyl aminopeptidase [Candidatus Peribacteraceae bacterium]
MPRSDQFQIFTPAEQESLRRGGSILRDCLKHVSALVRPGITTQELDEEAEAFIRERGGEPAFLGYHGFTGTLCTSVNDEVVHGIPSVKKVLMDGDIVSLDCGVILDELYTDACVTVPVGTVPAEVQTFLATTSDILERVVREVVKAGARVGDISGFIEQHIREAGYTPIPSLTGHGLGFSLHQFPDVPNVGTVGTGPVLPVGTMIAIEPIPAMGRGEVVTDDDNWTVRTKDGSLACHFEHSVLITEEGCEIIA